LADTPTGAAGGADRAAARGGGTVVRWLRGPRRRRGRLGRRRRRGLPAGADRALGAARPGDQRAQRRRGQHQLELAGAGRRIDRHDRGAELGQRQREHDEVGHVAEHQPDPRAVLDPHRLELLRAPVDALEQAAPRQVVVAIDQSLLLAPLRFGGLAEPVV
jgi:hypothetical protein